jgi:CubicO group peptidase (beta-lactamase class C family)
MTNAERQVYEKKCKKIFNKVIKSSMIHESSLQVENTSGDFSWNRGYGGRTVDSPMILASVTKLFTTTCILNLKEQGKLTFQDKLLKFFNSDILDKIHIYKGKDYSYELTVGNLLFQNSGFPDVFAVGKDCLNKRLVRSDIDISFEEYVKLARENKKKFAPGAPGKAHYSDLNFIMLGKIIEQLEHCSLHEAYKKYVFEPLKLQKTYIPEDETYFVPNMYHKHERLYRPVLIRGFGGSGACIGTSRELMIFIKAFFGGKLFDKKEFEGLRSFGMIQYAPPLGQYGGGFVRLNIAGIASMYRCKGELIGHMGGSGSFAYYYPEYDLYFVGDVSQIARPGLIFTIPLRLAKAACKL